VKFCAVIKDHCLSYPSSVLNWIERIIEGRYGHHFTIRAHSQNKLTMNLSGSSKFISFDSLHDSFFLADANLPFTSWNADFEGWSSVLGSPLPAPGLTDLNKPLITTNTNGIHIGYDLIGLTYWMLSRQEEVNRRDLDEHGRFPARASHAFKNGYLDRPIVDEWLDILSQVIKRIWPEIKLKSNHFNLQVSHDVDEPSRYGFRSFKALMRAMAGDILVRNNVKSAIIAPWVRLNSASQLHRLDPANTFEWIMDQSDINGILSTFYFLGGSTNPSFDADYSLNHSAIRGLMRRIHERGHRIGLHPSYGSYRQAKLIKLELNRLKQIAAEEGISQERWGARMHYLRWEHPTTLQMLTDAGLSYDNTLSYADMPGFRCGTCFEYEAFDPVEKKALPISIQPLIVMDRSLFSSKYLSLDCEMAIDKIKQLKNICTIFNGSFSILWHNTELVTTKQKEFYKSILSI